MTSSGRGDGASGARARSRASAKGSAASSAKVLTEPVGEGKRKASKKRTLKARRAFAEERSAKKADTWPLQDAKARFSELVRRVKSKGPQHVTVHGREEVVVVAADEFRRLKGERNGAALVAAMQSSPHRELEIGPDRAPMPVRRIEL